MASEQKIWLFSQKKDILLLLTPVWGPWLCYSLLPEKDSKKNPYLKSVLLNDPS